MIKNCLYDNKPFEATRTTAKFCSTEHRVAYARQNNIDTGSGEMLDATGVIDNGGATMGKITSVKRSENPFEQVDDSYDAAAALASFKKMGLDEVEWLSTGIPSFDALTKIPKGRLTQIEGRYSVGKTTLCLNIIAGMKDRKVLYIDSEASLNPHLLVKLRLDPKKFELYNKSAYLDDISPVLIEAVKSGKYDMIVLDSLAMTTAKSIEDSGITASDIGRKAKIFNKTLELIMGDLRDSKTALVIINQTRDKIGTYTPETYTPGGTGKDYNASLMISLKTIKSWRFGRTAADTKAKKFIGQEVEATIIKSKVNTPWRTAKFKLYYPDPIQKEEDNETQF